MIKSNGIRWKQTVDEYSPKLRVEIEEIRQLLRLHGKKLNDMERIVDSLKLRLDLIDKIPSMEYEIDLLKLKMSKPQPKG